MKTFYIILSTFCFTSFVYSAPSQPGQESSDLFRHVMQFFGSCSESANIAECLGEKIVIALNRASRSNKIDLVPGIAFVR